MDIAQKSILAKLLATEDISVEHQQVPTAAFDLSNRKIILPMWKDMTSELYDLLIGHEVGHALYTPSEGWHDQIADKGANFKGFLNVIEDARIERQVKSKFPGLVKSFYAGYRQLFAQDFFGVKNREVQDLPLIDRINLHYKIGNMLGIEFNAEEQFYINRIDLADTWEEVLAIASDLFEYSKTETEMQTMLDALEYSEQDDEGEESEDEQSEGEQSGDEQSEESEESEDEQSEESENAVTGENSDEPVSITDKSFRDNESSLLDYSAKAPSYAKFPTNLNPYKFVKPIKDVWDTDFAGVFRAGREYFSDAVSAEFVAEKAYNQFNLKNTPYINSLVQQFEMRRKASELAKARQNKTGKLNTDKLWATRLTEDVFLSNTVVPNGKNHGMMLFLDFSGSMYRDLTATIEQLLIQISFCKKVNIPFDVYSFTEGSDMFCGSSDDWNIKNAQRHGGIHDGTLYVDNKDLNVNHLISSSLSASEYKKVFRKLLALGEAYSPIAYPEKNGYASNSRQLPKHLIVGGTPLAETALIARNLIQDFKNKNRVEIMNVIFLTDGGATSPLSIKGLEDRRIGDKIIISENGVTTVSTDFTCFWGHTSDLFYRTILKHIKATVECNLINFHIGNFAKKDICQLFAESKLKTEFDAKYKDEFLKNNFFELKDFKEFDVFYAIKNGNNLNVVDAELEVKSDKKGDLVKGFRNFQKNKTQSRVFLNRFIDKVA